MGSTEQGTHPNAQRYARDGSQHSGEPRMAMGDLGGSGLLHSTQPWGAEGSGTCRGGSEAVRSGRSPPSSLGLTACSPWLLTAWEGFCLSHLALGCAHLHRGAPRMALGSGNIQLGHTPCQAIVSLLRGRRTALTQACHGHLPQPGHRHPPPALPASHQSSAMAAVAEDPHSPFRWQPKHRRRFAQHSPAAAVTTQGRVGARLGTAPLPTAGTGQDLALPGREPHGSQPL